VTGVDVDPGDPLLVGVPGPGVLDTVGSGGEPFSDARALGEVVVVRAGAITLHVGLGSPRRATVELHPATHPDHRLNDVRRQPTDP